MDYLENHRSLVPTALPAIKEPSPIAGIASSRALARIIPIINAHHVREVTQIMAAARILGATEFHANSPVLRVFNARTPGNGGTEVNLGAIQIRSAGGIKVSGFEYVGSGISIKF